MFPLRFFDLRQFIERSLNEIRVPRQARHCVKVRPEVADFQVHALKIGLAIMR
jgi:hypothetical protein